MLSLGLSFDKTDIFAKGFKNSEFPVFLGVSEFFWAKKVTPT